MVVINPDITYSIHQIPMVALTMMNTFTATELKVHYTDRYRQTALMLCCSRRYNKVVIHKMMELYSKEELNLYQTNIKGESALTICQRQSMSLI